MDAWAETQKKDIEWVEESVDNILKARKDVYIKKKTK